MKDMRMLGNMVHKLSDEKGFSAKAIADKINSSEKKVWAFYKGRAIPSFDQLSILAELFHVSIDELLSGDAAHYNESVVHCMNDFSNTNNREMILDIIDDYFDVYNAVVSQ